MTTGCFGSSCLFFLYSHHAMGFAGCKEIHRFFLPLDKTCLIFLSASLKRAHDRRVSAAELWSCIYALSQLVFCYHLYWAGLGTKSERV